MFDIFMKDVYVINVELKFDSKVLKYFNYWCFVFVDFEVFIDFELN